MEIQRQHSETGVDRNEPETVTEATECGPRNPGSCRMPSRCFLQGSFLFEVAPVHMSPRPVSRVLDRAGGPSLGYILLRTVRESKAERCRDNMGRGWVRPARQSAPNHLFMPTPHELSLDTCVKTDGRRSVYLRCTT